jgi:membrane protein YqaA with SNARE-associated domain
MGSHIHGQYAEMALISLCILESVIFFPSDAFLAVYCVERKDKAYSFAFVATCGALIGGLISYTFGVLLWNMAGDHIIHNSWVTMILSPAHFYHLSAQFQKYQWVTLVIAGLTPIPFKAATLTAGFCKLPLLPFLLGTLIARSMRFFAIATAIRSFNDMQSSFTRYTKIMIAKLGIVILISLAWYLTK